MCGIAGLVGKDLRFKQMLASLQHRGKDYTGIYEDKIVKLGHHRLSIIDFTEAGNQPIEDEIGVLVCNGEIYNYKDFYKGNGNDCVALFELIKQKGINSTLKYLNGMYAFAYYDKKEKKIHLIVDRMGQKPLYYYKQGDVFAFASSPNALLYIKDKWKIDNEALNSYWMLGSVIGEKSIWEDIYRIRGGQHLIFDINKNTLYKEIYWTPEFISNAEKQIEEIIFDSINKIKTSDVPMFIFLSGGIDSSLVASQFQGGNAIHLASDEQVYCKEVAEKFHINVKYITPNKSNFYDFMKHYCLTSGEPSMAGIIPYITAYYVSKYTKVAISANGADELFGGYDRTQDVITDYQLQHIFRKDFLKDEIKLPVIDDRLSLGRWLELQYYVHDDLNKTLDFASMSHTLEVRSPFLDHRLVEIALSIPLSIHGNKKILKGLLRRMGFNEQFLMRPKKGFSMDVDREKLDAIAAQAFEWCINNGVLKINNKLSGRDEKYLKMSAFGFKCWYEVWEKNIKY